MKAVLLTILLLSSGKVLAQSKDQVRCTLKPRVYVGNVYLDANLKTKTFEISYDRPPLRYADPRVISVQGTLYSSGKDSMGFDQIWLCTGEPCSGPTDLGFLKAVDQENWHYPDRTSYFDFNTFSQKKISFERMGKTYELDRLSEFECSYE